MQKSLFERILYATDMSERAIISSHYALRMCRDYGAHLTIVYVAPDDIEEMSANMNFDLASHYSKNALAKILSDKIDKSKKALSEQVNSAYGKTKSETDDGVDFPHITIRCGEPAEQILLEAENDRSDLIIVGTGRYNVMDKILLGSVSREVVKKSQVPVITIPLAIPVSEKNKCLGMFSSPAATSDHCKQSDDRASHSLP